MLATTSSIVGKTVVSRGYGEESEPQHRRIANEQNCKANDRTARARCGNGRSILQRV